MKKRALSALLCLVMVISLLPGTALAAKNDVPEAPAATQIPMTYTVYCKDHGTESVNLIGDTFEIGDVTEIEGEYVCPITIYTKTFAEDYSVKHGEHAALAEKVTFNMKWDGLKWRDPAMTELPTIELACAPEAPAATLIPQEYLVGCACYIDETVSMSLLPDTFEMGEVAMVDGKFVCPFTIKTAPYVEEYSKEHGKHVAEFESVTFNMTWDGLKWVVPEENERFIAAFRAPAMTAIPTDYIVSCEKHASETMNLIGDTLEIGEVTKKDGEIVCPITIKTAPYAEEYSKEHGEHAAVAKEISFNMKWDGLKWIAPAMTELPAIKLECVVPAAPAANELPARYYVSCAKHESAWMFEIPGTVEIGEVTQQDSGDYVCTITVSTADYAKVYSEKHEGHTAVVENVSYTMAWNGRKWVAPAMNDLPVIELACPVTEPEAPKAPEAPAATELPMGYMVKCNQGRLFHGARFIYQQPEGFTIGEVEKVGDTYVCTVTVDTEQYAKAYSNCWSIRKTHTAVDETISFQMTWNGEKWVAPAYTELPVIYVACARSNSWFPVNFPWLKW